MEGATYIPGLRRFFTCTIVGAALSLACGVSSAQGRPEVRMDAVVSSPTAVFAGAGYLLPMGTYVRSGLIGGIGVSRNALSIRADFVNIFHTDPFRESRWAPYGGAGLSFRHDNADDRSSARLLVLAGVEGPVNGRYSPALEIGLGGGVRVGAVLRRARGRTR